MARLNYKEVLKGDKGTTFTPHVTEEGLLYWKNDGGLINPTPVNIQGKQGEQGEQGEIGRLTEEQEQKIDRVINDYNDAISNLTNGNENATNSEIVQARNGEVNLNRRLDKFDSQLDNKIRKGEVSVFDIDKNKGKFDQTFMTEEFLQQIVGNTPISTIPAKGIITDEMCARPYAYGQCGKNLFNKNGCEIGKYVTDNGTLDNNENYIASPFIKVEPNSNYFLNLSVSWGFQFCYYNINFEFVSKETTKGGVYTIPNDCYYVRFTLKKEENLNILQFEKGDVQTEYEEYKIKLLDKSVEMSNLSDDVLTFLEKTYYTISCKKTDNEICFGFKYNATEDMRILFKPCGCSSLPQINNIYKLTNYNKLPSLDFSSHGVLFQEGTTDWIGPYIIRTANNDGDMPDSWNFTGGWHGFNGDQTGSATARNISCKYYLDNIEINDNNVKCGSVLKIIVVNRIQSTDTKKEDGSGREVLEEQITYIFNGSELKVEAEIKALENIKITKYYGLQTNNQSYDGKLMYYNDVIIKKWADCSGVKIDGGIKSNSECCEYRIKKNNDMLVGYIDTNFGLGKRKYVDDNKPTVWTADYNKSYMVLVDGNLDIKMDEVLYWRGGYKFISLN